MNREEVRRLLNDQASEIFDDIVNSCVLGANNHIRMIGEIMILISEDQLETGETILEKIRETADFFMETRGQQSRAIYNAIQYYIKDLEEIGECDDEIIRERVAKRIRAYKVQAEKDMDTLVSYGIRLAENMDTIMIFDYSSTVDRFVAGLGRKRTIYIPESRALDGGRPFVKTALEAGHEVHFIPDTTMLIALKKCQAAFMGAETVYPDGTVFNTVGSDILAILCGRTGIPLYVLSPMAKVDTRPVYGYIRLSPMPFDYALRLAETWEPGLREQVDFRGIKLLEIAPEYIRSLVTEKGIIPPSAFFHQAMEYACSLRRDVKNL